MVNKYLPTSMDTEKGHIDQVIKICGSKKSIDERETADVSINNTGYITNLELTGIETTVKTRNIYTD